MPDLPVPRVGTPLDRLVQSVQTVGEGATLPRRVLARRPRRIEQDHTTREHAKAVVMLRYGVNSHEALAMLAGWSRTAGVSVTTLVGALIDGTFQNDGLLDDWSSLDEWLEERLNDTD